MHTSLYITTKPKNTTTPEGKNEDSLKNEKKHSKYKTLYNKSHGTWSQVQTIVCKQTHPAGVGDMAAKIY